MDVIIFMIATLLFIKHKILESLLDFLSDTKNLDL